MNSFDKVGLIINPVAGKGFSHHALIAQQVLKALHTTEVWVGPGQLGARALEGIGIRVNELKVYSSSGRAQTYELAHRLAELDLRTLIVIGGDGTLSDVACALADVPAAPPILGIGSGSTNAGRLVTCKADRVDALDPTKLRKATVPGLLAYHERQLVGVGFNDCVLGFTVVGTVDGFLRDIDAARKMEGVNVPGQVKSIGTKFTLVERLQKNKVEEVCRGEQVATVVIGFAEAAFFAKAVTGGICLASLVNAPAGCLVADQPLVRIEIDQETVLQLPPIHSIYVPLDETMSIRVVGVADGTALCVDGNPLRILRPSDQIEFGVRRSVVESFQLVKV